MEQTEIERLKKQLLALAKAVDNYLGEPYSLELQLYMAQQRSNSFYLLRDLEQEVKEN